MTTLLIAFLFTFLFFGFFMYHYAWRNRFATQIRLSIYQTGGRVVSLKRVVRISKKMRVGLHLENPPGIFIVKNVEWQVVYKDRFETLHETRCRPINGQLYWDPPLSSNGGN